MNQVQEMAAPTPKVRRYRKVHSISVRVERELAERLRLAAEVSEISPSDKVRRILDAALPKTP